MTRPRTRVAHVVPAALLGLALIAAAPTALAGPSARGFERAARLASDGALTVPADPLVRDVLERITASTRGRDFFAAGLDRAPSWSAVVDPALAAAALPPQLAAVPLVESGYANFSADDAVESLAPGPKGAGLWMFIPSTARSYGLVVEPGHDERLDPERETDAAVRLLGDLHDRFGDWGLALAAYNQGASHVQAAIELHGTRDALELAERGALNDYVPTVYAAMLIRAEPSLVGR